MDNEKISIVIVLRRSPYDLTQVYDERKLFGEKSKENASSEILGVITYDAINQFQDKVIQINVTDRNIQEVLEKLNQQFQAI